MFNDVWRLDVESRTWHSVKLNLNGAVTPRFHHTTCFVNESALQSEVSVNFFHLTHKTETGVVTLQNRLPVAVFHFGGKNLSFEDNASVLKANNEKFVFPYDQGFWFYDRT